ncbi:MAG: hypothetical protein LBI42_08100 [Chitinispirillales bacterium]|jgi:hypothetical protein|nr:hypothetical protein [Chitinispirillales bacterium]
MRNNNNRTRIFITVNIVVIISVLMFMVSCDNYREMNFTFNNKTSSEIDSIQVIINDGWQVETTEKIPSYKSVKLTVTLRDVREGYVKFMLFYDSFKKEMGGIGYFSGRSVDTPSDGYRFKFSIIETDTGLVIINDYEEKSKKRY